MRISFHQYKCDSCGALSEIVGIQDTAQLIGWGFEESHDRYVQTATEFKKQDPLGPVRGPDAPAASELWHRCPDCIGAIDALHAQLRTGKESAPR